MRSAISRAKEALTGERLERVESIGRKIASLRERSLLRKQEYRIASGPELERHYAPKTEPRVVLYR